MKHFNQISKILLIVMAIAGLAIGMSVVAGNDNSSNIGNPSIFANNNIMDNNCGSGKCGGDDTKAKVSDKVDEAKEAVTDAKCGEGKCGEGKCGGSDDNAVVKKWNFMDIDTNEDGKVSTIEFTDYGTKEFPNKDANNDGKITSDECFMFESFNIDGNDYLSKTEFQTGHNKMFSKMDKNSDGFIDANESKSMHKSKSSKCGDNNVKSEVSDKAGEAKAIVSNKIDEAKCGAGKCG